MKGTVNPFEPWRPLEARIPPRLHASRPWRPPPPRPKLAAVGDPLLVEPVKPLPQNKPSERTNRRQGPTRDIWLVVPLCLALVSLGLALANLEWMEATQLTRFWAVSVCALLLGGIVLYHRRGTHARLVLVLIVLALAGIALWVVPTIHGVSLWSAYRQIEELRALPAGDVAGYQRGAEARRALVEDFPSFAADVRAAEQAWLRRTVDDAIEKTDRQLDRHPDEALAQLRQLDTDLSRLENYATVKKELEAARRRAVQACVKVVQQP